jgi:two-component system, NarL family, sensor kinase
MRNSTRNQLQQANLTQRAIEAERKRIADDLHDGLGQMLTMLKFRVEDALIQIDSNRPQQGRQILDEVVFGLRAAVGDVRRIATELRPSMLDDLGLIPTLQWLARQFEAAHSSVAVNLELNLAEDLIPGELKTTVFRLIQEALNNVAKHAQASSVFIYIRSYQSNFLVGIVDNGIGFDVGRMLSGNFCLLGAGVNSMRERVEISDGKFKIQSHIGSGTAVTAGWGSDNSLPPSGFGLLDNYAHYDTSLAPLDVDISMPY